MRTQTSSIYPTYAPHLLERLRLRRFPYCLPAVVYLQRDVEYLDGKTGHRIALKRMCYKGRERYILVAYDVSREEVILITCHIIREAQVEKRVKSGRWLVVKEDSANHLR